MSDSNVDGNGVYCNSTSASSGEKAAGTFYTITHYTSHYTCQLESPKGEARLYT